MKTGSSGTFVISWSQTETDGLRAAPLDVVCIGAAWRWTGQPVRVDGLQGPLVLEAAEGAAEIRQRAAQMVRRLIGAGVASGRGNAAPAALAVPGSDLPEQGFILTDGRISYAATIIEVPDTGARLVMFLNQLPPREVDLWVVRTAIDRNAPGTGLGPTAAGGVICFTPDTRIATADGPREIRLLRPGDQVLTKDNGPQPILWLGQRRMSGARLYAMPHLRPIRFRAGALGIGRPDPDLLVSPQHRMLVRGAAARALFNADEVLVAAEDMVNGGTITVDHSLREVTYVHILLEVHQIVFANGLESESFHPANTALDLLDPVQREVLLGILPGLAQNPLAYGDHARRNLSASEAAILRHDMAA
ncbi:MAG: Hint domain-containing protein [Pseudorhodobacter sp.]|nr:Hint domain-containing protein [Pseudorhodobacter sp.]